MSPSDFNQIGGKESIVARYSEERKEAVMSKLLPPYNMTVAELARQEGISEPTLYTWRNKAQSEERPVPGMAATSPIGLTMVVLSPISGGVIQNLLKGTFISRVGEF